MEKSLGYPSLWLLSWIDFLAFHRQILSILNKFCPLGSFVSFIWHFLPLSVKKSSICLGIQTRFAQFKIPPCTTIYWKSIWYTLPATPFWQFCWKSKFSHSILQACFKGRWMFNSTFQGNTVVQTIRPRDLKNKLSMLIYNHDITQGNGYEINCITTQRLKLKINWKLKRTSWLARL